MECNNAVHKGTALPFAILNENKLYYSRQLE